MLENLAVNSVGKSKRVMRGGRPYIVVPMTLIVPGVLNGSRGALYYPPEEIAASVDRWNDVPIVIDHPVKNGRNISGRSPDVLDEVKVGRIYGARIGKGGKLVAEGWFDEEKTSKTNRWLLDSILSNRPVELSTGLYTNNEPAPYGAADDKGRPYQYIAREYVADHLAILPTSKGACSIEDGCGVLIANRATSRSLGNGWTFIDNANEGENCGTGAGGFKEGNTCGKGRGIDKTEIGKGESLTDRARRETDSIGSDLVDHFEAVLHGMRASEALDLEDLEEAILQHTTAADRLHRVYMSEENENRAERAQRASIAHDNAAKALEILQHIAETGHLDRDSDGRRLYNAVLRNTGDRTSLNALADWLEENGEGSLTHYLRRRLIDNSEGGDIQTSPAVKREDLNHDYLDHEEHEHKCGCDDCSEGKECPCDKKKKSKVGSFDRTTNGWVDLDDTPPVGNLFGKGGGDNCGIGSGGFEKGNKCASGGGGGVGGAIGSAAKAVGSEASTYLMGSGAKGKFESQLEDAKGVAKGLFSRATLGVGPLAVKGAIGAGKLAAKGAKAAWDAIPEKGGKGYHEAKRAAAEAKMAAPKPPVGDTKGKEITPEQKEAVKSTGAKIKEFLGKHYGKIAAGAALAVAGTMAFGPLGGAALVGITGLGVTALSEQHDRFARRAKYDRMNTPTEEEWQDIEKSNKKPIRNEQIDWNALVDDTIQAINDMRLAAGKPSITVDRKLIREQLEEQMGTDSLDSTEGEEGEEDWASEIQEEVDWTDVKGGEGKQEETEEGIEGFMDSPMVGEEELDPETGEPLESEEDEYELGGEAVDDADDRTGREDREVEDTSLPYPADAPVQERQERIADLSKEEAKLEEAKRIAGEQLAEVRKARKQLEKEREEYLNPKLYSARLVREPYYGKGEEDEDEYQDTGTEDEVLGNYYNYLANNWWKFTEPVENAGDEPNCGTGKGGFQEGNTCARGREPVTKLFRSTKESQTSRGIGWEEPEDSLGAITVTKDLLKRTRDLFDQAALQSDPGDNPDINTIRLHLLRQGGVDSLLSSLQQDVERMKGLRRRSPRADKHLHLSDLHMRLSERLTRIGTPTAVELAKEHSLASTIHLDAQESLLGRPVRGGSAIWETTWLKAGNRPHLVQFDTNSRSSANWNYIDNANEGENCGTGKGGFQEGNTCGKGRKGPDRTEIGQGTSPSTGAMHTSWELLQRARHLRLLHPTIGSYEEAHHFASRAYERSSAAYVYHTAKNLTGAVNSHREAANLHQNVSDVYTGLQSQVTLIQELRDQHRKAARLHNAIADDLINLAIVRDSKVLDKEGKNLVEIVLDNTGDKTSRAALADWLEEKGEPGWGEAIRDVPTVNSGWIYLSNAGEENCGTGAGGFKQGNTCGSRRQLTKGESEEIETAHNHIARVVELGKPPSVKGLRVPEGSRYVQDPDNEQAVISDIENYLNEANRLREETLILTDKAQDEDNDEEAAHLYAEASRNLKRAVYLLRDTAEFIESMATPQARRLADAIGGYSFDLENARYQLARAYAAKSGKDLKRRYDVSTSGSIESGSNLGEWGMEGIIPERLRVNASYFSRCPRDGRGWCESSGEGGGGGGRTESMRDKAISLSTEVAKLDDSFLPESIPSHEDNLYNYTMKLYRKAKANALITADKASEESDSDKAAYLHMEAARQADQASHQLGNAAYRYAASTKEPLKVSREIAHLRNALMAFSSAHEEAYRELKDPKTKGRYFVGWAGEIGHTNPFGHTRIDVDRIPDDLRANASYFSRCDRNEKGWCISEGGWDVYDSNPSVAETSGGAGEERTGLPHGVRKAIETWEEVADLRFDTSGDTSDYISEDPKTAAQILLKHLKGVGYKARSDHESYGSRVTIDSGGKKNVIHIRRLLPKYANNRLGQYWTDLNPTAGVNI